MAKIRILRPDIGSSAEWGVYAFLNHPDGQAHKLPYGDFALRIVNDAEQPQADQAVQVVKVNGASKDQIIFDGHTDKDGLVQFTAQIAKPADSALVITAGPASQTVGFQLIGADEAESGAVLDPMPSSMETERNDVGSGAMETDQTDDGSGTVELSQEVLDDDGSSANPAPSPPPTNEELRQKLFELIGAFPKDARQRIEQAELSAKQALEDVKEALRQFAEFGDLPTLKAQLEGLVTDANDTRGLYEQLFTKTITDFETAARDAHAYIAQIQLKLEERIERSKQESQALYDAQVTAVREYHSRIVADLSDRILAMIADAQNRIKVMERASMFRIKDYARRQPELILRETSRLRANSAHRRDTIKKWLIGAAIAIGTGLALYGITFL